MSSFEPTTHGDIAMSLALGRYAVMTRANALLGDVESKRGTGDVNAVAGLLMSALEELKVAEEELRAQNAVLEAQRAGIDERTRHYRQLFLRAPISALITDASGTIIEANADAGQLLRRAPEHLERKPIAAFVPSDRRDQFRREFSRLGFVEDVRDWHVTFNRTGDTPIDLQATVRAVPDLGPMRNGVLYWALREITEN